MGILIFGHFDFIEYKTAGQRYYCKCAALTEYLLRLGTYCLGDF